MLASGETKFFGEPVAAVAAETKDAAEAAAALVRVEYRSPARCSVRRSRRSIRASPLVQDPAMRPNDPLAHTNVLREWTFGWGTSAGPLPAVIEHEYRFPMVTHFAIEPHVFLAAPDANGVTIWTPTQHPFVLQRVVAAALGWPIARVRIIAPDPGGGFGGKGWPKFEPLLAVLALQLGPARAARADARGDVSGSAAHICADSRADRVRSRRPHRLPGAQHGFPDRRVRRHRRPRRQQGELRGVRPVSHAARAASPRARCCRTPRRAPRSGVSARRRRRGPSRVQLTEAAGILGIDPVEIRRRNLPQQRRSVHSERHAGGRRLGGSA